jgi:hypothetical protein
MRYRKPFHASDMPHAALPTLIAPKKTVKNVSSPRAHPVRQGDLGRRIKARDDKRPRSSRDETCAQSDYGLAREPQ